MVYVKLLNLPVPSITFENSSERSPVPVRSALGRLKASDETASRLPLPQLYRTLFSQAVWA